LLVIILSISHRGVETENCNFNHLRRLNVRTTVFVSMEDIIVSFTAGEFSIVLGLYHVEQPIDMHLSIKCNILSQLFSKKNNNITHIEIPKKLKKGCRHT